MSKKYINSYLCLCLTGVVVIAQVIAVIVLARNSRSRLVPGLVEYYAVLSAAHVLLLFLYGAMLGIRMVTWDSYMRASFLIGVVGAVLGYMTSAIAA